ncbi:hypothetical protein MUG84_19335 [Paenibacillus sp. KQZ6P-2]|uniref:DUF4340 domain-containing protein n=1 Tax=Paenibacillus mangrovi TaxID=2931978 RepID=A0A9X1WRW5_9BACL|nr:hypothetical protein [Paenibacillus mangrovi]MCJ8013883.1 hypothetical protein [Paenibacillus mangrovi]
MSMSMSMVKKRMFSTIIVIGMILTALAFADPNQSKALEQKAFTGPGDIEKQRKEETAVWGNREVTSIEWEGKRTSWILKSSDEDVLDRNQWTLNGAAVSAEDVKGIISQMNNLISDASGSSRKASSLKAEVIESTVTLICGPDQKDKIYQIAIESPSPETLWIIPAGESKIYPVPLEEVQELERDIDQIKESTD